MSKYWVIVPKQPIIHLVLKQMVEDSFVLDEAVEGGWDFREFGVSCGAVELVNQFPSQDLASQI